MRLSRANVNFHYETSFSKPIANVMAIVEAHRELACVPKTSLKYVFCFSKSQYYIPADAIISYPKRANKLADGVQLGNLLNTKAPEKWYSFTHPDFLMRIKGEEGTCIYTTFEVEGHENEVRFVRLIARGIAEKNFAKWQVTLTPTPTPAPTPTLTSPFGRRS